MAVYTQIHDDELKDFLKDFDLGDLVFFKGIAEGVENTNYLLKTTKESYILTLFEKRVKKEELPFFLELKKHLVENKVNCPLPIANKKGRELHDLCGKKAAIFSFLNGVSPNKIRSFHCFELGKALAEFHLAGQSFKLKRKNTLDINGWNELFKKTKDQADTVIDGLAAIIDEELLFLNQNWPKDLPFGVIHADLFPDNVFFMDKKLTGLIDFYFACNDILAYDIAICLNAWCFEDEGKSFNITKAKNLLSGYQKTRPLDNKEINALPILARGSALRFLLTRLYDLINTPKDAMVTPKNPIEYCKKLRFHQKCKSTSSYGLDF